MKHIAKRREKEVDIPMASTSDIAFLLIIFFMVSTVFRKDSGLDITLPQAEATERILKRRNVSNVWINERGGATVDDNVVSVPTVVSIMSGKVYDNPDLVVMLQADEAVDYGYVTDMLEAFKEARAYKVTFATQFRDEGG